MDKDVVLKKPLIVSQFFIRLGLIITTLLSGYWAEAYVPVFLYQNPNSNPGAYTVANISDATYDSYIRENGVIVKRTMTAGDGMVINFGDEYYSGKLHKVIEKKKLLKIKLFGKTH